MKRLAAFFGCLMLFASPAMATSDFARQWKAEFLTEDTDEDFAKLAKKTGCYVCHVKGEDKKEVRNEYGIALSKYLKSKELSKDYIKENPEEAKKKFQEGFKKGGEAESKDKRKFADKIKANELPATDAYPED